jgi:NADPH:quinone reductase
MKAIVVEAFGPPDGLALRELPSPRPGDDEVLIDIHAAGVNFPDLLVTAGKYQVLAPLPFIIGKEGAGTVRSVGQRVTAFRPGQRVVFEVEAGAFAERICVRQAHCFPVPDDLGLEDAAGLGLAYQTAWFALTDRGQVKAGEWVLVTGAAGGVGIAAVQLARAFGANVIAGVGTASKGSFVREHGAHAVVDLGQPNLSDVLRDQVHAITGGKGLDVVVDMVGGDAFAASLRAMGEGGRMLVVGFAAGTIPQIRVNYLLLKHLSVVGVNWGVYRAGQTDRIAHAQARIFDLATTGALRSPVTATYPLAEAARALNDLQRRSFLGKIVLTTSRADHHTERSKV